MRLYLRTAILVYERGVSNRHPNMGDVKPDVKPPAGDQPQHLQIKIRSQEGEQIEFKVKPTTKFEKVMLTHCTARCYAAAPSLPWTAASGISRCLRLLQYFEFQSAANSLSLHCEGSCVQAQVDTSSRTSSVCRSSRCIVRRRPWL